VKIDFNQEIKTIEGATLMRVRAVNGAVTELAATLRWAAVEALLTTPSNLPTPAEEKARRYDLALKIQGNPGRLDLSVDDLSFIKKLCDEHFPPLVMGQTRRMLEGED